MALLLSRIVTQFTRKLPFKPSVAFLSSDEQPTSATQKKRKAPEIRVNLIENNSLTVMSMESAKKLANHRGVQLLPVEKPVHWMVVGNRPAYLLVHPGSKVASNKEENVRDEGYKGLKKAVFGTGIQENDIETKVRQIKRWVASGFVVDIAIDVSEMTQSIQTRIEESVKDDVNLPGIVKRKSKTLLRIQYQPIKKNTKSDGTK